MANLLETYRKRLAVSESYYAKSHNGTRIPNQTKIVTAKCLENIDKYMNEAFDSSTGTQRADLGKFKKFALNLTTVTVPNLILNDLMIVSPMSSITGYVTYLNYVAGVEKGGVAKNAHFNGVFALGDATDERTNYTSSAVVETAKGDASTVSFDIMFSAIDEAPKLVKVTVDGTIVPIEVVEGTTVTAGKVAIVKSSGKYVVKFGTAPADGKAIKIAYEYDNVVVPQNVLPTLKAQLDHVMLEAKARRIAVFYSQIAAFQAKTDYGFDLADQLAQQAAGELAFEIDTEGVNLLRDYAKEDSNLVWSRLQPIGVNKADHYASFSEMVEVARAIIYKKTKKFAPNYMLIDANILPILTFINGFKAAPAGAMNGPYYCGTLNSVKVYVCPSFDNGKFVLGVNGSDLQTSAAVYAPYMPIVPTQLLQYADGGTTQGWSTMYDMKILSKVEDATMPYGYASPLLIAGRVDGGLGSANTVQTVAITD